MIFLLCYASRLMKEADSDMASFEETPSALLGHVSRRMDFGCYVGLSFSMMRLVQCLLLMTLMWMRKTRRKKKTRMMRKDWHLSRIAAFLLSSSSHHGNKLVSCSSNRGVRLP